MPFVVDCECVRMGNLYTDVMHLVCYAMHFHMIALSGRRDWKNDLYPARTSSSRARIFTSADTSKNVHINTTSLFAIPCTIFALAHHLTHTHTHDAYYAAVKCMRIICTLYIRVYGAHTQHTCGFCHSVRDLLSHPHMGGRRHERTSFMHTQNVGSYTINT